MDRMNTNFPLKTDSLYTYWSKTVEYLLFLAVSIHSSMFQGFSAFKERSCARNVKKQHEDTKCNACPWLANWYICASNYTMFMPIKYKI